MSNRGVFWGATTLFLMSSCWVLSACGGSGKNIHATHGRQGSTRLTATSVGREAAKSQSAGHVVNPTRVPAAIQHTGLIVTFRPGPTPSPFVRSVYGTAQNSHGATVNFGFFLADGTNAAAGLSPAIEKLVPDATSQGTVAGESYVEVTSAGAGSANGSTRNKEEFEIEDRLEWKVARLAGAAFDEEGP
jgi:hypothetical protein